MKGIMLFANGFEDVEALATVDVLNRAQIELLKVSVSETKEVISSANNHLLVDALLSEIDYSKYDFLILPGGGAVKKILLNHSLVLQVVDDFCLKHKLVCAICAAPLVLNQHGYLKNVKYTCFKGCEKEIDGFYTNQNVEYDHHIITARSMYYSCDFALKIVEVVSGKEKSIQIANQIKSL